MKKYFALLLFVAALVSCNSSAKQTVSVEDTTAEADKGGVSFELDDLMSYVDENVDKPVSVTGYVTHTCKHSGRRCFLAGESQKYTVRVEAKGNIGGFNKELTGTKIKVDGTLRERRLTTSEINAMEETIEAKRIKDDGSAEACDTETANVEKMRAWMKENGKDYYSIYFIDGEDYVEVN